MSEQPIYIDNIMYKGRELTIEHYYDQDSGPPWGNDCGTGEVSDWTSKDRKHPWERILCTDDRGKRSVRLYDWRETMLKARKDGWGLGTNDFMKLTCELRRCPTAGQVAEVAVQRDFDWLRGWCNNDWYYIGIVVTDDETDESESLWGIESDCHDYIKELEAELCEQVYLPSIKALMLGAA